ncbi:MAG: acyl--CoA ligase [Clostridia bacterium]|nr:acyl--CoA ligase [Clostridia bacterium]
MTTHHLTYPGKTLFQLVEAKAKEIPEEPALEFYGKKITYRTLVRQVERAARAFVRSGIQPGDRVTISMPNTPALLYAFYALNRIGAVANMIHPLSAENEIVFYLNLSRSKMILTPDMFADRAEAAAAKADHPVKLLVYRMQDDLPLPAACAFTLMKGRRYLRWPHGEGQERWSRFLRRGDEAAALPEIPFDKTRTAVILYSGGTSGKPKGICLSDLNINACAIQAMDSIEETNFAGAKMLSCMPGFHGFGLGINLHLVLIHGGVCILMPTFNAKSYAQMLMKKQPNFIAGVPTIFEALLHLPELDGADLSFLRGMFCGGDSLSVELKKKVDAFLKAHRASIQVREGYGLTECVTASCLTPRDDYRPGSIGLPFADTEYRIVEPGTENEMPRGQDGEIILTGPTVMLGYLDDPEETGRTLRALADGKTWLYTGDLGFMDEEGFVYFRQRIKRMIITNGYNVYPGQIENAIDSLPEVAYSCVIGVKDPRRMQRVKAFVVLKEGIAGDEAMKGRILEHLKKHIAGYALPKEIEFRGELPHTLVGKIAYRQIQDEADSESERAMRACG